METVAEGLLQGGASASNVTPSGHSALGDLSWGSHLCHFYETAADLADCLVPYFKAGLENNEACLWVTAPPLGANDATTALRAAVPDLDQRLRCGQIEIVDVRDYCAQSGQLDPRPLLESLLAKKDRALAQGYAGLRASGSICWHKPTGDEWRRLTDYEALLNACLHEHRILGLCSYHLDCCNAANTIDVVRSHQVTLTRHAGAWEAIETKSHRRRREALAGDADTDGEVRLRSELAAFKELQRISTELIREQDVQRLYGSLVDAAAALMRSDFATMQMLHPARGKRGELQMLAHRGFDPEAIKFWDWVRADSGCTCGKALSTGQRGMATDVRTCDFMAGTPDREALLQAGVQAAQSTPLVSRTGRLLGMISTHWRQPHTPSESDLRRFDVLARLAADLVERKLNEEQIKLLGLEAEHRSKNALATLQAAMRLTQADSLEAYKEAIEGRLQALANAHSLFAQSGWKGAELRSLVLQELLPYGRSRVEIDGVDDLSLEPSTAQTLALCLHELTTNAAKYGALSVPAGRVRVEWSRGANGRVSLQWSEKGGPSVRPPTRRGFGTKMFATFMQMKGKIELDWRIEGLQCEITMPEHRGVEAPMTLAAE